MGVTLEFKERLSEEILFELGSDWQEEASPERIWVRTLQAVEAAGHTPEGMPS